MAVARCAQGHFFDDEKFAECPHCKNPPPRRRPLGDTLTEYRPSSAQGAGGHIKVNLGPALPGDEKTVGIFQKALGCDPVVGWLVCVRGRETGRDYRLRAGRNLVGRAINMDISLPDDAQISREDHCSIVFEPKRCIFLLARGVGDGVLVNGARLAESLVLDGGETIEIGTSSFVFIPFCGEGRSW